MKALVLHSFRTNAKIMKMQMEMADHFSVLPKGIECIFLDGIHECTPAEAQKTDPMLRQFFPEADCGKYREWWNSRRPDEDGKIYYDRFDDSISFVAEALKAHDFDGIIGFSQGGSLAATVLAMSIQGEVPSLKWAWIQSSFIPRHDGIQHTLFHQLSAKANASFLPKVLVTTHDQDAVVPSGATRSLAAAFPNSTFVSFPGRAHRLVSFRGGSTTTTTATAAAASKSSSQNGEPSPSLAPSEVVKGFFASLNKSAPS